MCVRDLWPACQLLLIVHANTRTSTLMQLMRRANMSEKTSNASYRTIGNGTRMKDRLLSVYEEGTATRLCGSRNRYSATPARGMHTNSVQHILGVVPRQPSKPESLGRRLCSKRQDRLQRPSHSPSSPFALAKLENERQREENHCRVDRQRRSHLTLGSRPVTAESVQKVYLGSA